jgi:hypothetical protein
MLMKMTATVPSSAAEVVADPAAFLAAIRAGDRVEVPDFDYRAAAALAAEIAERDLAEEMVPYRGDVTGIDHTVFISPKGHTQHAARIKLAIDPPHTVDPRGKVASIAIHDGRCVAGETVPPDLREKMQQFIDINRDALLDYWEYRIDTEELRRRLRSI